MVNVDGDGNCFFHAVARQIGGLGYTQDHKTLREIAINYMLENAQQFQGFAEGEADLNGYIDMMSQNRQWADNLIIQALANALDINITIIPDDNNPVVIQANGGTTNAGNINIGFIHRVHYVSLEQIENEVEVAINGESSGDNDASHAAATSTNLEHLNEHSITITSQGNELHQENNHSSSCIDNNWC